MFVSRVIKGSQLYYLSLHVHDSVLKIVHVLISFINPPTKEGEVAFNSITSKVLRRFYQ